jgi:16S rRNA (guanine(966)-N(2))-methyltransferase RsmD
MKLYSPAGDEIRPTSDRMREDIFNILSLRVAGCDFLDLYAGTGAMSVEALSRGARHATLVENSQKAIALIQKNMDKARYENYTIARNNVKKYLYNSNDTYDIIFMDPPYAQGSAESAPLALAMGGMLREGGVLAIEGPAGDAMPDAIGNFEMYRKKDYSAASVYFYRQIP